MSEKCCGLASCDNTGGSGNCRCCGKSCSGCEYRPTLSKEDVLEFIEDMRAVTPGELTARYGKGEESVLIGKVYVAFGLPHDLVTVLLELIESGDVFVSPCALGILDWIACGCSLPTKMKMATTKTNWASYKTERWFPCEFTAKRGRT
jgi:hypothetical protein